MKNFLSAQDIEDLAAQGKTELVIDDDVVLTDLARHTAQQFGISIVHRARSAPVPSDTKPMAAPPPPAPALHSTPPVPAHSVTTGLGSKPKGCQHGPLTNGQPKSASVQASSTAASGSSTSVVDQLVGLVKRFGNGASGN